MPGSSTPPARPHRQGVGSDRYRAEGSAACPRRTSTSSRGGYDDFNSGDIEAVTARFDADIEWIEPGGGNAPAGTFRGPQSVANDVFAKVPENFDEFTCTVEEASDQGDTVVAERAVQGQEQARSRARHPGRACLGGPRRQDRAHGEQGRPGGLGGGLELALTRAGLRRRAPTRAARSCAPSASPCSTRRRWPPGAPMQAHRVGAVGLTPA